jgi:hypothetical protein
VLTNVYNNVYSVCPDHTRYVMYSVLIVNSGLCIVYGV